jgi:hypothetical protein
MSKFKRAIPWVNLAIGLAWILTALRDIYMPGFLSVSHLSNADKASLAPMYLIVGALWLLGGLVGVFQARRNPEGKIDPPVTTIFGRQ